ncbi:hypothetical protein MHY85_05070 [Cellulomonas sp. ACRRI]|uniref:hypothetical protein n=1 Tax=Cellulomonas sp. ACRRI TaxID=2918188 RepID=UPI001EF2FDDE|nr:hypothetical protein [Cellulomonas sp. ACRRI]MCG7285346.1 hypothetical protein [Cellulomonas sp. ACRRI]
MPSAVRPNLDLFAKNTFGQTAVLDLGNQAAGVFYLSAIAYVGAGLTVPGSSTRGSHKITVNGGNASNELGAGPIVNDPTGYPISCLYNHPGGPMVVRSEFRVNNYDGGAYPGSRVDAFRVA